MALDSEDAMWLAADEGVFRFDGDSLRAVVRPKGEAWFRESGSGGALALGEDGQIWVSSDGGLVRAHGSGYERLTATHGLTDGRVGALLIDRAGDLWVGTGGWNQGGSGVARYLGNQIDVFDEADGLPAKQVMAVGQSVDGDIWFGTWENAARFDGQRIHTLEGTGHSQSILSDPNGDLWLGGRGIFRCRDGDCEKVLDAPPGIGSRQKNAFALAEGRMAPSGQAETIPSGLCTGWRGTPSSLSAQGSSWPEQVATGRSGSIAPRGRTSLIGLD